MKRAQSGFSLLELLVAFAIMALSLGVLYQASASSVRNVGEIRDHARAVLLAESLLATRDFVEPQGWNESGQFQTYTWQVRSVPQGGIDGGGVVFHRVGVDVAWQERGRARSVELVTLMPQARPLTP